MAGMVDAPQRPILRPVYVALALVGWAALVAWWTLTARSWFVQQRYVEVLATVDEVTYERGARDRHTKECSTGDGRGTRSVLTTYSYEVGGRRYSSAAYDHRYVTEIFCTEDAAMARVAELESKRALTVFYDPDDPSVAVQKKEELSEVIFVHALLLALGGGLVWLYVRQRRVHREYQASFDAWASGK